VGVQAGAAGIGDGFYPGAIGLAGKTIESKEVLKLHKELTRLFQPGNIGRVEVRNRIVMPAMAAGYATEDGYVTDRLVAYYEARARGGVGLILTGGAYITDVGRSPLQFQGIYEGEQVPGLKKLARAIKAHETRAFIQLIYPGSKVPAVPDPSPMLKPNKPPAELSKEEIQHLVELFVQAAVRAREAEFEGIDIHGAHGYLPSQFLSPKTNPRDDEYGGSAAKRARFACEILRAIKQQLGQDFPIIFRMNGDDYIDGGLTIEDAMVQAPLLVEAGADALSISAVIFQGHPWQMPTLIQPSGCLTHLAAAVKKVVTVPVITVGKIGDPVLAEEILQEGKADFVAMGRALLADPELPNKARLGKLETICPCTYCSLGCSDIRRPPDMSTRCAVNPACGRELESVLQPAPSPKRVIVIGGGLAGMEAARTLAQRGHEVSLYEKSDRLGGQWNVVSSFQPEVNALTKYLAGSLDIARVKVFLNKEVNRKIMEDINPEVVIIATGATPMIPEVPGVGGKNVVLAWDVLAGKVEVGQEVVIIGGELVGLDTALHLAKQGKKVSVVEMLDKIAHGVFGLRRWNLKQSLMDYRVCLYPGITLHSISERGVSVIDGYQMLFLKADTVVLATRSKAENELAKQLKGLVPELYTIGDSVEPRNSMEAIHEGFKVGREI
jgi:2,4-dienoyl-CoA reductase-like NADH-dependent reductase (Old Yellow Enzyme family)/thioredoxin reductase